jgi:hypothetical protein
VSDVTEGQYFVQALGQETGPHSFAELQGMVKGGSVSATTMVRKDAGQLFQASQVPGLFSDKSWTTALILSVLTGGLGIDRFYLGYTGLGIAKLLTLGGCGVWAIIDIVLIATRKLPDANGMPLGA